MKKTNIKDLIYNINGKNIILDSDLANLYNCKNGTKEINQIYKKNIEKFNLEDSFQLTNDEKNQLWSLANDRNVIKNFNNMSRVNPRVFTENGVKILASILRKNDVKITTPYILDAFKIKNKNDKKLPEIIESKDFRDKIYTIRNVTVMLDFDLAEIYGYDTKNFNRQVKNNIEKFDYDFMFQLTEEEFSNLRCNFCTSSLEQNYGGRRYLPYAFTEQGIYMLMTVLKGNLATRQSKTLIRLFKSMKDYIVNNNFVNYKDFYKLADNVKQIENTIVTKTELQDVIDNFNEKLIKSHYLILNGKQVEADIAYKEIYSLAKKSIYIIDNYIGLKTLVLLKDINKSIDVTIFSDNINKMLHKLEYKDFNKTYNLNINFKITNNKFHDRYIVIDFKEKDELIYHCGSSSKDSGNRITTIEQIQDTDNYKVLINNMINNTKLVLT